MQHLTALLYTYDTIRYVAFSRQKDISTPLPCLSAFRFMTHL